MTLTDRARTIREALDAGVSVAEVRGDVERLINDVEQLVCGGTVEVAPR